MGLPATRLVLAACAIALLGASPAVEQLGGTRAAIVLPGGKPAGSVILIPGGTTLQTIEADGSGSNAGNFVVARMRGIARPVFFLATSNGTGVARIDVTGPVTGNDPREPFSAHGYDGVETDVTAAILAWMHAHSAQGTN